MSTRIPPPRLFVIAASAADEAVIFRKGPADWCHVIRWNTADDSFHAGAWIKAQKVELTDGKVVGWQVIMEVTFVLDD